MLLSRFARLIWEENIYYLNEKDNQIYLTEGVQIQNIKVINNNLVSH